MRDESKRDDKPRVSSCNHSKVKISKSPVLGIDNPDSNIVYTYIVYCVKCNKALSSWTKYSDDPDITAYEERLAKRIYVLGNKRELTEIEKEELK